MAKTKTIAQSYPRIEDQNSQFYGCLDDSKLVPHKSKIAQEQLKTFIIAAINDANKKSSREILAIPPSATKAEIEKIYKKEGKSLFKYFKKYCGDPAATAHQINGKNYREVGKEQFRNRTLQKERMNSGWRYQFLAVECAQHIQRFKSVSPIGAAEGDFSALVDFNDKKQPPLSLYVSIKNRSNTMGGQDWPKAILALEDVAKQDKNRTGAYCCVFGIAMDRGERYIKYSKKSKAAHSVNTEIWLSDFFWPFFTNCTYEEIMMAVLNVLMTKNTPPELSTQIEIPDALLDAFGECCIQEKLIDELGNFNSPDKLVQFFCRR